ncbi:hypothetical protein MIND_00404000 [Mycena indigotica]|uniref:F-box domain-containing protein n=1 Tax=Mycena indigotica TaxID=2126181 RepID=A0A8H6T6G2_9AGAR|nr:uncharacterized protein MIND_00404000 [Mycena indigotica]KAF7310300.1 hypothetical protein MIND_00404000 [Mycena indigotica]
MPPQATTSLKPQTDRSPAHARSPERGVVSSAQGATSHSNPSSECTSERRSPRPPALPFEVWSMIFEMHNAHCRASPSASEESKTRRVMMAHYPLMAVSRTWKDVVMSTTSLWAWIMIEMGWNRRNDAAQAVVETVVSRHLQRSKLHPLHIFLSNRGKYVESKQSSLIHRIFREAHRFQTLDLTNVSTIWLKDFRVPQLEFLALRETGDNLKLRTYTRSRVFWNAIELAPLRRFSVQCIYHDSLLIIRHTLGSLDDRGHRHIYLDVLEAPDSPILEAELVPKFVKLSDLLVFGNTQPHSLTLHGKHRAVLRIISRFNSTKLEQLVLKDSAPSSWMGHLESWGRAALIDIHKYSHLQRLSLENINFSGDWQGNTLAVLLRPLAQLQRLDVSDYFAFTHPGSFEACRFPLTGLLLGAEDDNRQGVVPMGPRVPFLPALDTLTYRVDSRIGPHHAATFPPDLAAAFLRDATTTVLKSIAALVEGWKRLRTEADAPVLGDLIKQREVMPGWTTFVITGLEAVDFGESHFPWFGEKLDEWRGGVVEVRFE